MRPITTPDQYLQLWLFDAAAYAGGRFEDPLAGWPLADVRAFAIDVDLDVRLAAAASRWNWDARVQRVLATDPDERVVLALLDHVDPYVDVCELIIAGPHVAARRELAGRNLRTELLERLARRRRSDHQRDGAAHPRQPRAARPHAAASTR